jgi:hypothetical protein
VRLPFFSPNLPRDISLGVTDKESIELDLAKIDREILTKLLKNHGYSLCHHEPTPVLVEAIKRELQRGEMELFEIEALLDDARKRSRSKLRRC